MVILFFEYTSDHEMNVNNLENLNIIMIMIDAFRADKFFEKIILSPLIWIRLFKMEHIFLMQ
jgi:hypothetical protein